MEAAPVFHTIEDVPESLVVQEPSSVTPRSPQQSLRPVEEDRKEKESKVEVDAEDLAQKMNQVATVFNTSLTFSVDKPTGKTVIKVLDTETDEIIRQIPTEEMLRLVGKMRSMMGMLLDVEI